MLKYIFLIFASILGCIWGYNLVFWGTLNFSPEISFGTSLGKIIVPGDDNLSKDILVYTSNINISDSEVSSLCDTQSRFIDSYKNLYFFEISYLSTDCDSTSVVLESEGTIYGNSITNLNLVHKNELIEAYIDYDSQSLEKVLQSHEKILSKTLIYKDYNGERLIKYLKYSLWQRQYREAKFWADLTQSVLDARSKKYISPVVWRTLSEAFTKIPNSPRPYRAAYTDGIHHGWDIDGNMWESVVALDDGIIVRIVDGFNNNTDFSRIEYGAHLTEDQKLKNLDILRWNQVWLKTMKWDVVFYSHLDDIDTNISEGMFITRWTPVGTTGVTGVPEVWYDDYHLHFAVMKNPYNAEMAGKYDFWDYMAWDWYGKWMDYNATLKIQRELFEK